MEESTAKVAKPVTKVENTPVTPVTPKKKFPVWAIVLIVIIVLCVLCFGGIILSGVFVAINPAKNISDARNTQRRSDVAQIFEAVAQAEVDGVNLSAIPTCTSVPTGRNIGSKAGLVNLTPVLVPTYLASVPLDPQVGTETDTGYTICLDKTETGVLRVIAPNAENGVLLRLQSE